MNTYPEWYENTFQQKINTVGHTEIYAFGETIRLMSDNRRNACVYDGVEYIITGRKARNKSGNVLIEIRPKFNGGFGNDLNVWAPPSELYQIDEENYE